MCIVGSSDSIANGYNSVLAKQDFYLLSYSYILSISDA